VTPEVVFLEHEYLGQANECLSQKLRHPLSNVEQKDLINRIASPLHNHLLQPLLGHVDNFLKGLVEFDLGELVRTFNNLHGSLVPLLVQNTLATDLLDPLLGHPPDVRIATLTLL